MPSSNFVDSVAGPASLTRAGTGILNIQYGFAPRPQRRILKYSRRNEMVCNGSDA